MQIRRVLLVHKKSIYQLYVEEHATAVGDALERGDRIAQRIRHSHEAQARSLAILTDGLQRLGVETVVRYRASLRRVRGYDLVIALGGDGTLLDTSRRVLDQTPLLGINSDPGTSVGALCAGSAEDIATLIERLSSGTLKPRPITRLRVTVDGEETLGPVLNDMLYAHPSPADMTRFELGVFDSAASDALTPGDSEGLESMRGSGIWVCTAAGSTAAVRSAGGRPMSRGSRKLQYVVREPYVRPDVPRPRSPQLGLVEPGQALVIVSRMRRGMVWVDGPHRRVKVAYGQMVRVDAHPMSLMLVPAPNNNNNNS